MGPGQSLGKGSEEFRPPRSWGSSANSTTMTYSERKQSTILLLQKAVLYGDWRREGSSSYKPDEPPWIRHCCAACSGL